MDNHYDKVYNKNRDVKVTCVKIKFANKFAEYKFYNSYNPIQILS